MEGLLRGEWIPSGTWFSVSILRMPWSYLDPHRLLGRPFGRAGGAKIEQWGRIKFSSTWNLQGEQFGLETFSVGAPVKIFGKTY